MDGSRITRALLSEGRRQKGTGQLSWTPEGRGECLAVNRDDHFTPPLIQLVRAEFRDVPWARAGVGLVRLRQEVTEPDARRTALYKEYLEVYRSLYPMTSSAMARLSRLAGE